MNTKEVEKRSLGPAKWANLLMGVVGIVTAIASNASALMDVVATKTGRALFGVAYIRPEEAVTVGVLDDMRKVVREAGRSAYDALRMEIIFTGKKRYD